MALLSTKGRYASRIMAALVRNGTKAPLRSREIARLEGLTGAYTEQILIRLKTAKLVRSVRGRSGGFMLNCDPAKTTVMAVLEAVENEMAVSPCVVKESKAKCPRRKACPAHRVWQRAEDALREVFTDCTLTELAGLDADAPDAEA